jgi:altronate dehydratase small subunit
MGHYRTPQEVIYLKHKAVVLSAKDNVATALANLKAEDSLELKINEETRTVKLISDVPFGHKFSLSKIEPGSPVIKYGEVIGVATTPIEPGNYVHIHNVVSRRGRGDLEGSEK